MTSATLWGLYLSPKAKWSLPLAVRLAMELALFAAASGGLWLVDLPALAAALLAGELIVLGSLIAVGQRPGQEVSGAGLFE